MSGWASRLPFEVSAGLRKIALSVTAQPARFYPQRTMLSHQGLAGREQRRNSPRRAIYELIRDACHCPRLPWACNPSRRLNLAAAALDLLRGWPAAPALLFGGQHPGQPPSRLRLGIDMLSMCVSCSVVCNRAKFLSHPQLTQSAIYATSKTAIVICNA